ncbi:ATP-binding cassette domain-containing protein, partial [Akkermansiaceae bacterium]|nr:ATP-binding cassette domain-containing protein [Akkermansiaceae bacterium]
MNDATQINPLNNFATQVRLSGINNFHCFGLEERKVDKKEIQCRVEEALAMVKLEGFTKRGIDQMSGGQQQRVSLARALVVRPKCLLLDEPLSNLDAQLRLEMRSEIRRIVK